MFGISPIGWVYTLGSLPAIPMAIYMFARYGRIVPQLTVGAVYFISMVIGAITVFLVAREPLAYVIGAVTLLLLLSGYSAGRITGLGQMGRYLETIFLSLTVFFLMVPTVTETLTRVPDGRPFASAPNAPIVLGAQVSLLVVLIIGLPAQIIHLRRKTAIQGL